MNTSERDKLTALPKESVSYPWPVSHYDIDWVEPTLARKKKVRSTKTQKSYKSKKKPGSTGHYPLDTSCLEIHDPPKSDLLKLEGISTTPVDAISFTGPCSFSGYLQLENQHYS